MFSEQRIQALGRSAWARWRQVGHAPDRAVELTCLAEIAQRTWSQTHERDRAVIRDRIRQAMLERDRDSSRAIQRARDRRDFPITPAPGHPAPWVASPYRIDLVENIRGMRPGAGAGSQPDPGVFAKRFVCLCSIDKWSIHARCCGIGRKVR